MIEYLWETYDRLAPMLKNWGKRKEKQNKFWEGIWHCGDF
jgi:hypothetical protein